MNWNSMVNADWNLVVNDAGICTKGLSPFQPEKVTIEAGRIMLHRVNKLLVSNEKFAFETTLATKSYKSKVAIAQKKVYKVILLFFWLQDVNLAIERVKTRAQEGGHNIETDVIKRRYKNRIKNLFETKHQNTINRLCN